MVDASGDAGFTVAQQAAAAAASAWPAAVEEAKELEDAWGFPVFIFNEILMGLMGFHF